MIKEPYQPQPGDIIKLTDDPYVKAPTLYRVFKDGKFYAELVEAPRGTVYYIQELDILKNGILVKRGD